MKKPNGTTSWIMVVFASAALIYNSIAVHVIAKNEIKHLQADVVEIKKMLFDHILVADAK